jgi:2-C-methyl-D-erythritol 4-phosphate cytidylyltransferase
MLSLQGMVKNVAGIIVAGGSGNRFGGSTPKQFVTVRGKPLVWYAVRVLAKSGIPDIIVVVPRGWVSRVNRISGGFITHNTRISVYQGGKCRADSVGAGLNKIPSRVEYVVIHDAVRPLASTCLVRRVLDAARLNAAAIPGLQVEDTIKKISRGGFAVSTLDRSKMWSIQTPQAFRAPLIKEAHRAWHSNRANATDDAAMVERLGHRVKIVQGEKYNVKVTTREDLALVHSLLSSYKTASAAGGRKAKRQKAIL